MILWRVRGFNRIPHWTHHSIMERLPAAIAVIIGIVIVVTAAAFSLLKRLVRDHGAVQSMREVLKVVRVCNGALKAFAADKPCQVDQGWDRVIILIFFFFFFFVLCVRKRRV